MPTEVLNNIWLASYEEAKDKEFLQNKKILFTMNISNNIPNPKSFKSIEDLKTYRIKCSLDDSSFYKELNNICHVIYKKYSRNIPILIFCNTGFQASPLIISAFLIKYANIQLNDIEIALKLKNKNIFTPDNMFRHILEKFQMYHK